MMSSLPPHRSSTVRWIDPWYARRLAVPALEPTSRSVAACCRHHVMSGRALCTAVPRHTHCARDASWLWLQLLRVVKWPRPPGLHRPDRRERRKRWSHLPIEGSGKLWPPRPLYWTGRHPHRPAHRVIQRYARRFYEGYMKVKSLGLAASRVAAFETIGLEWSRLPLSRAKRTNIWLPSKVGF
jgi:hypothetical protein